jgi:hypothetical protein
MFIGVLSTRPAVAAEGPDTLAGARATAEVGIPLSDESVSDFSGEVFARFFVSRSVALELSVGRRHVSAVRPGGSSSSSYVLTQYPVLLGPSYVFAPESRFRPRVAAGLLLGPYSTSFSSFAFPGPVVTGSKTTMAVGAFGGVGFQLPLHRALYLDGGAQIVYDPVSSPEIPSRGLSYLSASLGLAWSF